MACEMSEKWQYQLLMPKDMERRTLYGGSGLDLLKLQNGSRYGWGVFH
jgi:hypothetical protein